MADVKNFWQGLPRPFFVLAPMEDVTDAAFRALIERKGKPHVMYTEFTSGDGLMLATEHGRAALMKKLEYGEGERPIVAQIFGSTPSTMEQAAQLAAELGFDGLDINMGCPVKKIVDQGCGAALIRDPQQAKEIIRAAKRGAGSIPVSVKTRIGYNENELDTWLPALLEEEPAVVTIHARTRKEMSGVPAHWEAVKQAVRIRDAMQNPRGDASWVQTLIVGNGDVTDLSDARQKAAESGCDGVMFGRAIYGNPWLFRELHESEKTFAPNPREKIETLIEHLHLFEEKMQGFVHFALMKKHFKAYINGWEGAKELRVRLMETATPEEAIALLDTVQ